MGADFWLVVRWWGALFVVGLAAWPLTQKLFKGWKDQGYLFAKAVGMALVSWLVYVLGTLHLIPFTQFSIIISLGIVFTAGILIKLPKSSKSIRWVTLFTEEIFFFLCLLTWSWVKSHEPRLRGLEKFMDYG